MYRDIILFSGKMPCGYDGYESSPRYCTLFVHFDPWDRRSIFQKPSPLNVSIFVWDSNHSKLEVYYPYAPCMVYMHIYANIGAILMVNGTIYTGCWFGTMEFYDFP